MRSLVRVLLAVWFTAACATAFANDLTVEDIVNMVRAGLGDEVLIARIQTDGKVFHLTAAEILELHQAGASDGVILAMIETGAGDRAAAASSPKPTSPAGRPSSAPSSLRIFNNSGRDVTLGVADKERRIDILTKPEDGVPTLAAGERRTLAVPPGRYPIVVDDRTTSTVVFVEAGAPAEIELLPTQEGAPTAIKLTRAGKTVFQGVLQPASGSPEDAAAPGQDFYTCPMHPGVRLAKPGYCPQCGMQLEKVSGAAPALEPPPTEPAPTGATHADGSS